MNVGEQLVADYLQHVKKCQFVGQNLPTSGEQGEIDVVGIDIVKKGYTYARLPFILKQVYNTQKINILTTSTNL